MNQVPRMQAKKSSMLVVDSCAVLRSAAVASPTALRAAQALYESCSSRLDATLVKFVSIAAISG